jgi:hypothetical protein
MGCMCFFLRLRQLTFVKKDSSLTVLGLFENNTFYFSTKSPRSSVIDCIVMTFAGTCGTSRLTLLCGRDRGLLSRLTEWMLLCRARFWGKFDRNRFDLEFSRSN